LTTGSNFIDRSETTTEATTTETPPAPKPTARRPRQPKITPVEITPPGERPQGLRSRGWSPRKPCRETRAAEYFAAVAEQHHRTTGQELTRKTIRELMGADENKISTSAGTLTRVIELLAEKDIKIAE
jgi:hypothetical protein